MLNNLTMFNKMYPRSTGGIHMLKALFGKYCIFLIGIAARSSLPIDSFSKTFHINNHWTSDYQNIGSSTPSASWQFITEQFPALVTFAFHPNCSWEVKVERTFLGLRRVFLFSLLRPLPPDLEYTNDCIFLICFFEVVSQSQAAFWGRNGVLAPFRSSRDSQETSSNCLSDVWTRCILCFLLSWGSSFLVFASGMTAFEICQYCKMAHILTSKLTKLDYRSFVHTTPPDWRTKQESSEFLTFAPFQHRFMTICTLF